MSYIIFHREERSGSRPRCTEQAASAGAKPDIAVLPDRGPGAQPTNGSVETSPRWRAAGHKTTAADSSWIDGRQRAGRGPASSRRARTSRGGGPAASPPRRVPRDAKPSPSRRRNVTRPGLEEPRRASWINWRWAASRCKSARFALANSGISCGITLPPRRTVAIGICLLAIRPDGLNTSRMAKGDDWISSHCRCVAYAGRSVLRRSL